MELRPQDIRLDGFSTGSLSALTRAVHIPTGVTVKVEPKAGESHRETTERLLRKLTKAVEQAEH